MSWEGVRRTTPRCESPRVAPPKSPPSLPDSSETGRSFAFSASRTRAATEVRLDRASPPIAAAADEIAAPDPDLESARSTTRAGVVGPDVARELDAGARGGRQAKAASPDTSPGASTSTEENDDAARSRPRPRRGIVSGSDAFAATGRLRRRFERARARWARVTATRRNATSAATAATNAAMRNPPERDDRARDAPPPSLEGTAGGDGGEDEGGVPIVAPVEAVDSPPPRASSRAATVDARDGAGGAGGALGKSVVDADEVSFVASSTLPRVVSDAGFEPSRGSIADQDSRTTSRSCTSAPAPVTSRHARRFHGEDGESSRGAYANASGSSATTTRRHSSSAGVDSFNPRRRDDPESIRVAFVFEVDGACSSPGGDSDPGSGSTRSRWTRTLAGAARASKRRTFHAPGSRSKAETSAKAPHGAS